MLSFTEKLYSVETMPVIVRVVLNFASFVARCLLYFIGWHQPSEKVYNDLSRHEHIIAVFSHSSNWDFVFMCLYFLAYPRLQGQLYTLTKPQPFKYFGTVLRSIGCIPAPRLEDQGSNGSASADSDVDVSADSDVDASADSDDIIDKNVGFVNQLSTYLKTLNRFTLLLSPKGKRDIGDWRSGYYSLAKEFAAPCIAVGIDFESKQLVTCVDRWLEKMNTDGLDEKDAYQIDKSCVEEQLQKDMGVIVPRYPKNCEYEITRTYDKYRVSTVDYVCTTSTVVNLLTAGWLYFNSQITSLSLFIMIWMLVAVDYHRNFEQRHAELYCGGYLAIFSYFNLLCLIDSCWAGWTIIGIILSGMNLILGYLSVRQAVLDSIEQRTVWYYLYTIGFYLSWMLLVAEYYFYPSENLNCWIY